MTRTEMLAIHREICVAIQAVETAETAVHRATRAFSGCQLPTNTRGHLAQVHTWLNEELEQLAHELTKEAS